MNRPLGVELGVNRRVPCEDDFLRDGAAFDIALAFNTESRQSFTYHF